MPYVDGFLVPVPLAGLAGYRRAARAAARIWKAHGALAVVESVEDDVTAGTSTSFPRAVKRRRGELVVFSWIVFRSRAHRDRVVARVMADPRIAARRARDPLFDDRRMVWGGFRSIVAM